MKKTDQKCYFCGQEATTREHVPPKSLFTKNTNDLLTVPSCEIHNGDRKRLDEEFRNFLVSTSENFDNIPNEIKEKMRSSLLKNRRLIRPFLINVLREECPKSTNFAKNTTISNLKITRIRPFNLPKESSEESRTIRGIINRNNNLNFIEYSFESIARGIVYHEKRKIKKMLLLVNYCEKLHVQKITDDEVLKKNTAIKIISHIKSQEETLKSEFKGADQSVFKYILFQNPEKTSYMIIYMVFYEKTNALVVLDELSSE